MGPWFHSHLLQPILHLAARPFFLNTLDKKEVINADLTGYFQNPICKHNPSLPGLLGECTMTNYALTAH